MKKVITLLIAALVAVTTFAQTNLAKDKTSIATSGNAYEGNDGNTGSRWISDTSDPQSWMVDLGEETTFNVISICWEGAYAKTFTVVAGNELGDDGFIVNGNTLASVSGQSLSGFPYVQNFDFDPVNYRYVQFNGTERGTVYAYSFWEFGVYNIDGGLTPNSITINAGMKLLNVDATTDFTAIVKDQLQGVMTDVDVTWVSSNPAVGSIDANGLFTALAAGSTDVTASIGNLVSDPITITVNAVAIEAPTTNPADPTALEANVLVLFSDHYGKPGLTDSNPGWGISGGAPNPLYSLNEVVRLVDNHPLVHIKGAGVNGRPWSPVENAVKPLSAEYTSVHVDVYPFSATELNVFQDNAYNEFKANYQGLVPGQWNSVDIDITNLGFNKNYICIELVGEAEFYLDNFYFEKPAVADAEAPALEKVVVANVTPLAVTLALKATDNVAANVIYKITDADNNINVATTGANGTEINYVVNGLTPNTTYNFSVVAMDDNENTSEPMTVQALTTPIQPAPVPTQPADNVISIYSDAYQPATTYSWGYWEQSTQVQDMEVEGDHLYALTKYNYLGFDGFNPRLNLGEMEYVHVDVFPMQTMNFGITPIMSGVTPTENSQITRNLTAGEWNSIEIPMSQFGIDFANGEAFQLKIDQGNGTDALLIDNIYFYKSAGEEPVEPTEGQVLTADGHTVVLNGYHYTDTDNYELIITSQETMVGLGGSFWHINGNEGKDLRENNEVSVDGHTITVTAVSTSEPQLYTPLYVLMPGEVNFGLVTIDWKEKGGEEPSEGVTAITIDASASEIEAGKTLQLSVKDQNGNAVTEGLTFATSDEEVATVDAAGLVTAVAEGNVTITATYVAPTETPSGAPIKAAGEPITAEIELTVTPAAQPGEGQVLTADGHTVTLVGRHYTDTDNYELYITSEEQMVGLGGSFWHINGNETSDLRTNIEISEDGHTIICSTQSTSEPQLYTPLYVLMPGEVNFGNVVIEWIEVGSTVGVTTVKADTNKGFNVYTIDGRVLQHGGETLIDLPAGLYIINGKKVIVK